MWNFYSTIAIPASALGMTLALPDIFIVCMRKDGDVTTLSFRDSTARLACTLLVSSSHTPVDGHGKESGWNFIKCYFPASASTVAIFFIDIITPHSARE